MRVRGEEGSGQSSPCKEKTVLEEKSPLQSGASACLGTIMTGPQPTSPVIECFTIYIRLLCEQEINFYEAGRNLRVVTDGIFTTLTLYINTFPRLLRGSSPQAFIKMCKCSTTPATTEIRGCVRFHGDSHRAAASKIFTD